jgi:hypothetical protein
MEFLLVRKLECISLQQDGHCYAISMASFTIKCDIGDCINHTEMFK